MAHVQQSLRRITNHYSDSVRTQSTDTPCQPSVPLILSKSRREALRNVRSLLYFTRLSSEAVIQTQRSRKGCMCVCVCGNHPLIHRGGCIHNSSSNLIQLSVLKPQSGHQCILMMIDDSPSVPTSIAPPPYTSIHMYAAWLTSRADSDSRHRMHAGFRHILHVHRDIPLNRTIKFLKRSSTKIRILTIPIL